MKFPTARHPLTDATEQTENVSDVSENHHRQTDRRFREPPHYIPHHKTTQHISPHHDTTSHCI